MNGNYFFTLKGTVFMYDGWHIMTLDFNLYSECLIIFTTNTTSIIYTQILISLFGTIFWEHKESNTKWY